MCKKRNNGKNSSAKGIDPCMVQLVNYINRNEGLQTLASCCGHGKYPPTVVVHNLTKTNIYELLSLKNIPRTRNFYIRDKEGYYHIPEIGGNDG